MTFQLLDPAYSAYFEDDDEDEEDPDARADPMYGLNLKQFLTEFLHDFCKQPYFPHFSQVRSKAHALSWSVYTCKWPLEMFADVKNSKHFLGSWIN